MEPMKNIPVYRHSAAYAVEHGELEAYKTSRVAGVACRDAIEKAVAKHYRDNCLNKAGAREVIDEFGKERVMTVLAITIRDKLYDGRFSSANKAWAQAFPIEPDIDSWGGNRNLTLVVRQTHPGLLNLCTRMNMQYTDDGYRCGRRKAFKRSGRKPCGNGKRVKSCGNQGNSR